MTLWNSQINSCKDWQPGTTVLLLSNPGYKVQFSGKGSVGIMHATMIDVEPDFPDADWLRKYAAGLMKKESLSVVWPEGVWDVEAAEYGVVRMLFTLAELDRWFVYSFFHLTFAQCSAECFTAMWLTVHCMCIGLDQMAVRPSPV